MFKQVLIQSICVNIAYFFILTAFSAKCVAKRDQKTPSPEHKTANITMLLFSVCVDFSLLRNVATFKLVLGSYLD